MADTHRIYLVRPPQAQPSTPEPLDAKNIASQALAIAKECSETLSALHDYSEMMVAQISADLAQLEILALRSIRPERAAMMEPQELGPTRERNTVPT